MARPRDMQPHVVSLGKKITAGDSIAPATNRFAGGDVPSSQTSDC